MGRDKAAIKLGGVTMLTLIRRMARKSGFPVRTIRRDRVPRCGPLGGIYTSLLTTRAKGELFLACDMPLVKLGLLHRLIKKHARSGAPVFTRCSQVAGFPLLLPCDVIAVVKQQIEGKSLSIQNLAAALEAAFVNVAPRDAGQLLNINTPAEWRQACDLLKTRAFSS